MIELVYLEVQDFVKSLLSYLQKAEKKHLVRLKEKSLIEYYRYLGKLLRDKNIRLPRGYSSFSKYLKLLEVEAKVNFFMLNEESSELYYELKKQYSFGVSKDLSYWERYLDLMMRYARNETTERESLLWEEQKPKFYQELIKLSLKLSIEDYLTPIEKTLSEVINGMQKFYAFVNQRNMVMVNNLLKGIKEKSFYTVPH
ncbi:MAG: hypothetical protein GY830_10650 [Bacteroidetes bacterium]|nr:hypothetical protein [Bacteroidota bacterium]